MSIIYIDGKKYKVSSQNNLLEICLSLKLNIPYFCWHPALGSVGSCRQCAITQYNNIDDNKGKLVMACMTPAINKSIFSINDNISKTFRKNIIELFMTNHPHDCPVCEEGGNCHLQDMTVLTNHFYRRYEFKKRTHNNQYIGPFITHEMNRCISCYRCLRFYKEYCGGKDFGVYGASKNIYFGRYKNGILNNEFSGNLIEICPTGVFTNKIFSKKYYRKWDIITSPSVCNKCSIGCNINIGSKNGEICYIENRFNKKINKYFICDLGRFSSNIKYNRPIKPLIKEKNKINIIEIKKIIQKIKNIINKSDITIGIGSPRTSIENNFALKNFVKKKNFYSGISELENKQIQLIIKILTNGNIKNPSLNDIEKYDTIIILGEDITQTGPRLSLSVRQAINKKNKSDKIFQNIPYWNSSARINYLNNKKNFLFVSNIDYTKLDDIASCTYYASVNEQARFGFALANKIDNLCPKVNNLNQSIQNKIKIIIKAFNKANKILIISGTNSGSLELISAASNIAIALKKQKKYIGISFIVPYVNSIGLSLLSNKSLDNMITRIKNEKNKKITIIILENDIYRNLLPINIKLILNNIKSLILIDNIFTPIYKNSNIILPSLNFLESSGTVINHNFTMQRFFQSYNYNYYNKNTTLLEAWRWINLIEFNLNKNKIKWNKLDDIINTISKKILLLKKIKNITDNSNYTIKGKKLTRLTYRYSSHTSLYKNNNDIHENIPPKDIDSIFSYSMENNNNIECNKKESYFNWVINCKYIKTCNKSNNIITKYLINNNYGIKLYFPKNKILNYFNNIPEPISYLEKNIYIIAPYWNLFNIDEISQNIKYIKKYFCISYIIFNYKEAKKMNLIEGNTIFLNILGLNLKLKIKLSKKLTQKQIGITLGINGIPIILSGIKINNIKNKIFNILK